MHMPLKSPPLHILNPRLHHHLHLLPAVTAVHDATVRKEVHAERLGLSVQKIAILDAHVPITAMHEEQLSSKQLTLADVAQTLYQGAEEGSHSMDNLLWDQA